jgi:hypothetical protein
VRQVLGDYNQVNPRALETVITLPGDGREIALSGLDGLIQVTDVWWPYDSDADEVWPTEKPVGFRLWWDDGSPVLFLTHLYGTQPQADDEMRIFYTASHTIQNLDSASSTTPIASHEFMIVRGAAGLACLGRGVDLNETAANMAVSTPNYAALARLFLQNGRPELAPIGFYPWLAQIRSLAQNRGDAYARVGWRMDKYDSVTGWAVDRT